MILCGKRTSKDEEKVLQELMKLKYTCNFFLKNSYLYQSKNVNILLLKYSSQLVAILPENFNQEIQFYSSNLFNSHFLYIETSSWQIQLFTLYLYVKVTANENSILLSYYYYLFIF